MIAKLNWREVSTFKENKLRPDVWLLFCEVKVSIIASLPLKLEINEFVASIAVLELLTSSPEFEDVVLIAANLRLRIFKTDARAGRR